MKTKATKTKPEAMTKNKKQQQQKKQRFFRPAIDFCG